MRLKILRHPKNMNLSFLENDNLISMESELNRTLNLTFGFTIVDEMLEFVSKVSDYIQELSRPDISIGSMYKIPTFDFSINNDDYEFIRAFVTEVKVIDVSKNSLKIQYSDHHFKKSFTNINKIISSKIIYNNTIDDLGLW